jgi:hypothetical protein
VPAFKDLWRSYCARHKVAAPDRDFALDLMDRASDVMKERAAIVAEERQMGRVIVHGTCYCPSCETVQPESIAAAIRALTDG